MQAIQGKPMSVNTAWKGRRYRSDDYELFRKEMFAIIPRPEEMYIVPIQLTLRFHLKNHKATDYDNLIKPLQDVMTEIGYWKDDNLVYRGIQEKIPLKKGLVDWFQFEIIPIEIPEPESYPHASGLQ